MATKEPYYLDKGVVIWLTKDEYDVINKKAHANLGLRLDLNLTPTQLEMVVEEQVKIINSEWDVDSRRRTRIYRKR